MFTLKNQIIFQIKTSLFLLFLFFYKSGTAQSDYIRFDHISIKDGLSQSSINCILQDREGFMWFGTQDGLNKFDGYEFTTYYNDPLDSNSLSENFIHTIIEDGQGYIWVGTDNGISRFDPFLQTFKSYTYLKDHKNSTICDNSIWSLYLNKDGKLFAGTSNGKLAVYDEKEDKFTCISVHHATYIAPAISAILEDKEGNLWLSSEGDGVKIISKTGDLLYHLNKKNGLPSDIVWSLFQDKVDNIWIGTNNGLVLVSNSTSYKLIKLNIYRTDAADSKSLSGNVVKSIHEDSFGNLWVGTDGNGLNKVGYNNLKANGKKLRFVHYRNQPGNSASLCNDIVTSIYEDAAGLLWIGAQSGLSKFDPYKQYFLHLKLRQENNLELSDQTIWSVIEDASGNLWLGTRGGLIYYHKDTDRFTHYSTISSSIAYKNNKSVFSIYEDHTKTLWIGTIDGLYYIEKEGEKIRFKKYNYENSKITPGVDTRVYVIKQDSAKNLWVGTRRGLYRIDLKKKKSLSIQPNQRNKNSLSDNTVRSIIQTSNGTIWIGTDKGLNRLIYNGEDSVSFKVYKSISGDVNTLANDMILSLWESKSGKLWAGTYGGGLNCIDPKTEIITRITEKNGLANNVIYGVLGDETDNIWVSTNKGISMYNIQNGKIRNYSENDGLQSNEFNIGAYFKNKTGELLFGGINGLNIFSSASVQTNPFPPEIVITDLKIFNKKIKVGTNSILQKHISYTNEIDLTYKENNFSIEFASLHYSFPERNECQYKMSGFEDEWVQAGKSRSAHYTNLDPGEYTFIVRGSNSDGLWSDSTASLKITISPPVWKTWWFRIIMVIAFLGLVYGLIRTRISIIRKQKELLEELVRQRTREVTLQKEKIEDQKAELQREKEKADHLLLNMLPKETVDELQIRGKARPRSYRNATVMFTDFSGFTQKSEKIRPRELLERLDRYFILFDEIIEKHNIEKIKTIGDSYMCAGGIPVRNKSNPIDVVLAGLEIQQHMRLEKAEKTALGEDFWELRLGIHTGELIAGIIGIKRLAYDIWGDTVNIASRMEMSGMVGKVNVSGKTYSHIQTFFDCTYRGKVIAKNKGEIDMYFVDRIKPAFSADADGFVPNDVFWDYVNLELYSSINYMKAEKYVVGLLEKELPEGLFYHGIHHTKDVCRSVERIAKAEGINGEDLFLLKTAALYHDAGFTKKYMNNEDDGSALAEEILPKYGYSEEQIETVKKLIMATRVPHHPQNLLEQIICDADLDYLGRNDFHEISDTLRREFLANNVISNDKEWDELQVKFLTHHRYFTSYSIRIRKPEKIMRLEEVKARLNRNEYSN